MTVSTPSAILLGVVRLQRENFRPLLNPPRELILESTDRLVFLARTYEDCEVKANDSPLQPNEEFHDFTPAIMKDRRRILILGWNHKVAAFLMELGRYIREKFDVAILSLVPVTERETELRRKAIDTSRVMLAHCEGDYTSTK